MAIKLCDFGSDLAVTTGADYYAPAQAHTSAPLRSRSCPNCGAPVSGYKCEYCDSVFDRPLAPMLNLDVSAFASLPIMVASSATYVPIGQY